MSPDRLSARVACFTSLGVSLLFLDFDDTADADDIDVGVVVFAVDAEVAGETCRLEKDGTALDFLEGVEGVAELERFDALPLPALPALPALPPLPAVPAVPAVPALRLGECGLVAEVLAMMNVGEVEEVMRRLVR